MARKENKELRERIFQAAEKCFTQKGFHGVSMRDIAEEAETPVSNIYAHFENKETLFRSILKKYEKEYFQEQQSSLQEFFATFRLPESLEVLGKASEALVEKYSNYLRLIYVDVVEFQGHHISRIFSHMRKRYEQNFGPALRKLQKDGVLHQDINPVVAFMSLSMAYFNYYTVEKVFGAKKHFGMADKKVLHEIAKLFSYGMGEDKSRYEKK